MHYTLCGGRFKRGNTSNCARVSSIIPKSGKDEIILMPCCHRRFLSWTRSRRYKICFGLWNSYNGS